MKILREELYAQLCNQTWCNKVEEGLKRGWMLMGLSAGTIPPSSKMENYLLKWDKHLSTLEYLYIHSWHTIVNMRLTFISLSSPLSYVSRYGYNDYKAYCQHRLLRTSPQNTARSLPPCLLEWESAKNFTTMALKFSYPAGTLKWGSSV